MSEQELKEALIEIVRTSLRSIAENAISIEESMGTADREFLDLDHLLTMAAEMRTLETGLRQSAEMMRDF